MIFSNFDLSTFNALSYNVFYDEEYWEFCKSYYPTEFKTEEDFIRYRGSKPVSRKVGKYKTFKGSSLEKRISEWYKTYISDEFLKLSLSATECYPNTPLMIPHRDVCTQGLSMLCHLNNSWDESYGGQSCVYDEANISDFVRVTMNLSDEYESSLRSKPFERVNELKERWETLKMEKTVPSAIYKTKVMDKQILSIGKAWHGSAPISSFAKSNRRIAYLAFITNDKMNSLKCFDGEQSRVGHS